VLAAALQYTPESPLPAKLPGQGAGGGTANAAAGAWPPPHAEPPAPIVQARHPPRSLPSTWGSSPSPPSHRRWGLAHLQLLQRAVLRERALSSHRGTSRIPPTLLRSARVAADAARLATSVTQH